MEDKFRIQDIPGKGQGLVATVFIPRGTRVLSESPIIKFPSLSANVDATDRLLNEEVKKLGSAEKELFFNLFNAHSKEYSQVLGIVKTNALPLASMRGGIFLQASRINHACDPNSQNTWNEKTNKLNIHTSKDVEEGGEITISYLDGNQDYSSRQLSLRTSFNFTCTCGLCSMPPVLREESDGRLRQLSRLDASLNNGFRTTNSPLSCLHDVRTMFRLFQEEGIADGRIPRSYYDAFQIAIAHGDQARAKVFAQKAHSLRVILEGHDSPETGRLYALANNPGKHLLYGTSMKWKTSKEDIPQFLSEGEFEAWLWRLPTPGKDRVVCSADLKDNTNFPAFEELPWDNDVNLEYFEFVGHDCTLTPKRHWGFFAEVTDIEYFMRLRVVVRDKTGKEVPIAFYTDDRGQELAGRLRKGQTIAVLYAEQHGFLDMSIGIRQEASSTVKVFPISLNELFKLSDRVQTFSTSHDGERKCHGCGKMAQSLRKCAKCSFFWYCDKECQIKGWKDENHKDDCKILRDGDLQDIFRLDWDKFENPFRFTHGGSV